MGTREKAYWYDKVRWVLQKRQTVEPGINILQLRLKQLQKLVALRQLLKLRQKNQRNHLPNMNLS